VAIRAIEAQAKTATARRKAERTREARRSAGEAADRLPRPSASTGPAVHPAPEVTGVPPRPLVIEPFTEVEVL
jgi:hypothetical protein